MRDEKGKSAMKKVARMKRKGNETDLFLQSMAILRIVCLLHSFVVDANSFDVAEEEKLLVVQRRLLVQPD